MWQERRVALLPHNLEKIRNPEQLFFQKGYASHLGVRDEEYKERGASIIRRHEMREIQALCIPKPSPEDTRLFSKGQTLLGWAYVKYDKWLADAVAQKDLSVVSFEKMYVGGKHVFWENNFISGQLGAMQALSYAGKPFHQINAAIVGKGNVGKGAADTLTRFGVSFTVFDSRSIDEFYLRIGEFDAVFNCIKWCAPETENLITLGHIQRMKPGAILADITSNGVEGSVAQSIYQPVFSLGNVLVYNNEHIPTLWPKHASDRIGDALAGFLDFVIEEVANPTIQKATTVLFGKPTQNTDAATVQALEQARERVGKQD
jgi:N5-(carboxyethyl)ornithine synthase